MISLGATSHLRLVEPGCTNEPAPVCPTCKGARFAGLPTVITSNRALDTLDGRIVSRMYQMAFGGEILRVAAEDYRRLGARTRPA